MKHNTGLYIRRRYVGELWQLFLGGYTKIYPSELFLHYHENFKELHKDYEWVVLERRTDHRKHCAMYRVGVRTEYGERVEVLVDNEELVPFVPDPRYNPKMVKCLSSWHSHNVDEKFMGSISNRICPECVSREYHYFYDLERNDRTSGENEISEGVVRKPSG